MFYDIEHFQTLNINKFSKLSWLYFEIFWLRNISLYNLKLTLVTLNPVEYSCINIINNGVVEYEHKNKNNNQKLIVL